MPGSRPPHISFDAYFPEKTPPTRARTTIRMSKTPMRFDGSDCLADVKQTPPKTAATPPSPRQAQALKMPSREENNAANDRIAKPHRNEAIQTSKSRQSYFSIIPAPYPFVIPDQFPRQSKIVSPVIFCLRLGDTVNGINQITKSPSPERGGGLSRWMGRSDSLWAPPPLTP